MPHTARVSAPMFIDPAAVLAAAQQIYLRAEDWSAGERRSTSEVDAHLSALPPGVAAALGSSEAARRQRRRSLHGEFDQHWSAMRASAAGLDDIDMQNGAAVPVLGEDPATVDGTAESAGAQSVPPPAPVADGTAVDTAAAEPSLAAVQAGHPSGLDVARPDSPSVAESSAATVPLGAAPLAATTAAGTPLTNPVAPTAGHPSPPGTPQRAAAPQVVPPGPSNPAAPPAQPAPPSPFRPPTAAPPSPFAAATPRPHGHQVAATPTAERPPATSSRGKRADAACRCGPGQDCPRCGKTPTLKPAVGPAMPPAAIPDPAEQTPTTQDFTARQQP